MSWFSGLFGRRDPPDKRDPLDKRDPPGERDPPAVELHAGHIASWGARVAAGLAERATRYTQMTREHIIFSPADNAVRVVGGASGITPCDWPSEARLAHHDVQRFQVEFGRELTAALRLGYLYRLGPLGEWIFYQPGDGVGAGDPPEVCVEEWPAPDPAMVLNNDCTLGERELETLQTDAATARTGQDRAAAKRIFLRCCLAGLAEQKNDLVFASLGNLLSVYREEERWLRVMGMGLVATRLAEAVAPESAQWVMSMVAESKSNVDQAQYEEFKSVAMREIETGCTWPALLWALDDLEITTALAAQS